VTFSARDPDGWLLIRFAFFQDDGSFDLQ